MAARRLIILMVVLLAVSTLAAALLPGPESSEEEPTPTRSPRRGAPGALPDAGGARILRAAIDTAPKPPQAVSARAGDLLTLLVSSRFADLVEIPAFGLFKAVAPGAPARFELLLERSGAFPVRTADSHLLAGLICAAPEAAPGRIRASSDHWSLRDLGGGGAR
jgi:hypothetical protein